MNIIHIKNLSQNNEEAILGFISKFNAGVNEFNFNTSGSSGKPKKIRITRENLINSATMTILALNLQPNYMVLNCLNTDFIAGQMMLVRSLILNMTCIVVPPSADPLENVQDQIDFAGFVPYQLFSMLTNDKKEERILQLNRMKVVIVGGDSVSNQLLEAMQQIKTPIYHTYGMTETVSHVALKLLNGTNKQNSFEVLSGVKIKIDHRNCIQILASTTNNLWVSTNDIVELIDESHFNWLGRIDNVIVSGGIKISIESVENKIDEFLFQQNLAINIFVTSIPHIALGQELVLVLEDTENSSKILTLDILKELSKILPKYHTPKKIFTIEKFIKTPNGKINRNETKSLLLQQFQH